MEREEGREVEREEEVGSERGEASWEKREATGLAWGLWCTTLFGRVEEGSSC